MILGRFTPERKPILDVIKDELRARDYPPILFDFKRPSSRDTRETVSTLAHMARFVIADITDARSIPAELESIVYQLLSVPVQPLILSSDYEYGLFEHIRRFQSSNYGVIPITVTVFQNQTTKLDLKAVGRQTG